MTTEFNRHYQALLAWSESARQSGWLEERDLLLLSGVEQQQAEALFAQQGERPLIVAFFGGTGVGKSSLLNRLAREQVARVGVERPTSQEVTLYLHQDYQLGELPADLPVGETRIAYHGDDSSRLIAWLDMPDIDSVEQRHRSLVQSWLPYIDWLVYVVSPERYQDDLGWRFLQQRAEKHSWLFIMNQWDQGLQEQIEDFRDRLLSEGFSDPVILRTSCITQGIEDDFDQLEECINQAIRQYGLKVLQRHGLQARQQELLRIATQFRETMKRYPVDELRAAWGSLLSQRLGDMANALQLNARAQVQVLLGGQKEEHSASDVAGSVTGVSDLPEKLRKGIWSSRIDTGMDDLVMELENLVRQRGMPVKPFSDLLRSWQSEGRADLLAETENSLRRSLARPGGQIQRGLYRFAGWLCWLLPLASSSWAAYHLVVEFYLGTRGDGDFLGLDFAIHAGLLIGLSWFLPRLLKQRLKPSLPRAAEKGMSQGIDSGVGLMRQRGDQILQHVRDQLGHQISTLELIQRPLHDDLTRQPALPGTSGIAAVASGIETS